MTMSTGTSCDDSFKRPGSVPFKWESQPGVPKHTANPLAGATAALSSRPKLQTPPSRSRRRHQHHPRSASASPTRCRTSFASRTASPSASPSWKRPTVAVVPHGCFPAVSPLKRRDGSKSKGSPEAAPPRRPAPGQPGVSPHSRRPSAGPLPRRRRWRPLPLRFSLLEAPHRGRRLPRVLPRRLPAQAQGRQQVQGFPGGVPAASPRLGSAGSFSAFSAPLGRSSSPAAEVETPRSLALSGPLERSTRVAEEGWDRRDSPAFLSPLGRYHRAAEEDWARRGSPAFLSPLCRSHRAAEEAVSATRWLF